MPAVLPENAEVFNVYQHVKDQVVVCGGRAVAVDYNALNTVMDWLDIEDKRTTFERVVKLWNMIHFDNTQMEKVRQSAGKK